MAIRDGTSDRGCENDSLCATLIVGYLVVRRIGRPLYDLVLRTEQESGYGARRGHEEQLVEAQSISMATVWHEVEAIAAQPVPVVLVIGESGTGKSLVARGLHYRSARLGGVRRAQRGCDPGQSSGERALRSRARRLL